MAQPMARHAAQGVSRRMPWRLAALALILSALSPHAVQAATTAAPSPPALFTQSDAARGRQVYEQNCAACHGADLRGTIGPALIGPSLGSPRTHTTVAIMVNVIAFEMPAGAPASLPQADYAAVMAYLLQQNGYPAGPHALTYAAAQATTVPLISRVPAGP